METRDNSISLKAKQIYKQVHCKWIIECLLVSSKISRVCQIQDFKGFQVLFSLTKNAKQIVANGTVLSDRNICS